MFDSDDFDDILSQFEIPETPKRTETYKNEELRDTTNNSKYMEPHKIQFETKVLSKNTRNNHSDCSIAGAHNDTNSENNYNNFPTESPKHTKRKIISNHFDHQMKRKFPGPAGLLTGTLDTSQDKDVIQIELLSQDINCAHTHEHVHLFESSIWKNVTNYAKEMRLAKIDSVKSIKQQALTGNLRRRKAQIITAFVDAIDRSETDPLVILRDSSGSINCTLHRDAWSSFSPYILSDYCALVLWKPTVLTTGAAFKKHYLNITLSNILAIYSSTVLKDDIEQSVPEGYMKTYNEDCTIIKVVKDPSLEADSNRPLCNDSSNLSEDILDGLDSSSFTDDIF